MDDYKTLLLSKECKEKRHTIQILFKYLLLLVVVVVFNACQNKPSNNENKSSTTKKAEYPEINGFYIFKCNMSFVDVSNTLTPKNIYFKLLNLNKLDDIYYPLATSYGISPSNLKDFNSIKIIEGSDLPILNGKISKFQIGFFNDTIFYFKYEQNLETKYFQNDNKVDFYFDEKVKNDIYLLKDLSEGLNYKYGPPIINEGDLDAFFSLGKPYLRWNNATNKGIQYNEKQIWFSKVNGLYICLENMSVRDSSKFIPFEIKVQGYTSIEVLFDDKYAKQIYNYSLQKREYEKQLEKKRMDSTVVKKNKQFDKL